VRGDIPPGYQIAQSAHALADFAKFQPKLFNKWHYSSGYIVALHADDEPALLTLSSEANLQKLNFVEFREPDLNYQVTSLAFASSLECKRFLSTLKLAGRNPSRNQIITKGNK
jgi:hypothetical protein